LDTLIEEQEEEERKRKLKDGEDLMEYRQAVAARLTSEQESPTRENQTQLHPQRGKAISSKPMAARRKTTLKGVQVKRRPTAQRKSPDTGDVPSSPKRSKIGDHS